MGKVNLYIDGKEVLAEEGTTIMEAAKQVGIEIPHLCYEERLSPLSSCRLCVVEVEGMEKLVTSCSYPVREGMKVKTDTERVRKARKLILELLISNHPLDCMTCEKSGNCLLEKYAYELGVSSSRFQGEKINYPVLVDNPFIERDNKKCILCGRCVSVCSDVQQCDVLDFAQRGFDTLITTGLNKPLTETNCVFCGNCLSVCPVGALVERGRKGKGREWEFKKVTTICPYCGCGCQITLHIKDGKVVKVTSPPDAPVNSGWLCTKGKFGFEFINSSDRLTSPLIKEDGKFTKVSWEKALNFISTRLNEIKGKYGGDSIAGLSSAKCTNEENYLFQKFMRAVIGTNNVDHCARLCHSSTVAGLARAFGSGAMTNSIGELSKANCILVTGSNTSETHPIVALQIKAAVKNGATLIVADPRKIELTGFAHIWLRHRPGTDVALFNGLMWVILNEGLEDRDFIEKRTENFESLQKIVEEYTPQKVEKITGVPAQDIIKAARAYAKSGKSSIVYAMGITQHTTGTDNVLTLANLAMLCGMVGKESCGVNPLRGQNNVQGACDMGALPDVYPGYQSVSDERVREKFEREWGTSLPSAPGLTVVEMIHAIEDGRIKAMYIMGENSVLSDPNATRTKAALEKLEFLIVQDIFMSETADLADVVLPAACFAEKDGTFTNTERRIQKLSKALNPPGEARADWEIICSISEKMGYPMQYKHPAIIMEEIASLTPIYAGVSYSRLGKNGLQWPCTSSSHPGTLYLHKDKFTRGKGRFYPALYKPPEELPDEEYPFILSTGRVLFHFHTGTMTRKVKSISQIYPEGLVEINPDDAGLLNVSQGEIVRVRSRRGEVKVKVKIDEKSPPGVVFMTFHFAESLANILTIDALDPVAKIPEYKVCAVKIEKLQ
ncbi:formate dehydrogenase subunit alpha [Candidatus Aerophobetes bacterium]|nr:formate dehydrogenase subunit alpha [Candidatus Aerophobetes bacterium]